MTDLQLLIEDEQVVGHALHVLFSDEVGILSLLERERGHDARVGSVADSRCCEWLE